MLYPARKGVKDAPTVRADGHERHPCRGCGRGHHAVREQVYRSGFRPGRGPRCWIMTPPSGTGGQAPGSPWLITS